MSKVLLNLMRVTDIADDWEEADVRRRAFLSPEAARSWLNREALRQLLQTAMERLSRDDLSQT